MTRSTNCRLAIVASHPIQYFTPLYRRLARIPGLDTEVFFCRRFGMRPTYDKQFGREIAWDTDQLSGYEHRFLSSISPIVDTFNPFHAINPSVLFHMIRGFDAVWINGYAYPTNWLAMLGAFVTGARLLIRSDFRVQRARDDRWFDKVRGTIIRFWIRSSDAIMYVGKANREAYLAHGADPAKMVFTPFSVDVEAMGQFANAGSETKQRLRRAWNIPAGSVVVLFVGKLTPGKHPEALIELLINGRFDQRPHLVFAGSGPLEADLCEVVNRRSLAGDVSFLGFVNQNRLPEVYAMADIFVMPSEYEQWGLVLNEAMAAGLTCVASDDVGAVADLIDEGRTGFVFPSGDWGKLATLVSALVRDAKLRSTVGAAAQERAREYSYDATVRGILAALERAGVHRHGFGESANRGSPRLETKMVGQRGH